MFRYLLAGFTAVLPLLTRPASAQLVNPARSEAPAYAAARFPGDSMMKFISRHIIYPEDMRNEDAHGKVLVIMRGCEDGKLNDIRIFRSSGYKSLDNEALRVVRLMPDWVPARENGRIVESDFTVPFTFALQ